MSAHASMNRIFRLVWNEVLGTWVAVAENAKGRGKRSIRAAMLLAPAFAALGYVLPAHADGPGPIPAPMQLPTGGIVTAGQAALSTPGGAVLNIDQSTARAAITWNTFNLGSAAQVNFNQPNANSATLNRVLDSNPSQILGRITAPGQVILSNPNGVMFGKSATVDVGGLTATTHTISDADFMAGKTTYQRDGSTGSVINEGTLRAALGGYIALLAPEVRNEGVIVARMGTVVMAAGEAITLNFSGNNTLAGITVQPSAIKAIVENKGAVLAPGGMIVLSARALDRLQGGVVKNSGTLEATGLAMKNGRVVLEASDRVENSGTINADAGADGSPAGSISVTAPVVVNSGSIHAAAPIDATVPVMAGGSIALAGADITQTAVGKLDVSGINGGTVSIQATHDVALGGTVSATAIERSSATIDAGQGGSIAVVAAHDVTLNSAIIDASGPTRGGQIRLEAGHAPADAPTAPDQPDRPTLALLGTTQLRTSSRRGTGGSVTSTGDRVGLFDGASIDANGATGGGDVSIGGGFHGADASIVDANQVVIGSGASIDASATAAGHGGNVVVWSDGTTVFAGTITSRGSEAGLGGRVEVSGAQGLGFVGKVEAGTLLLDPRNITIDTAGAAALNTVDTFADTPSSDLVVSPNAITASTNAGTAVTLQANNDIVLNSSIVTANGSGTGGALTFQAGRSITLNSTIFSDDANILFTVNDIGADGNRTASTAAAFTNNSAIDAGAGTVTIVMGTKDQSGAISTGKISANALTINQNGGTLGAVSGQIDLGETNVVGALTISANSARNVVNTLGNVVVRGTATISVGTGDVTINRATTDFAIIGLTAGNVTLADANSMQFTTTTLSGNLIESTVGPMAQVGAVRVAGTTNLSATSGGFGYADPYVNVATQGSNLFTGAVTLNVSGTGSSQTGGYANLYSSGALNLVSASASLYMNLTTAGALTIGTLNAGSYVNLNASGAATATSLTASSIGLSAGGAVNIGTTTAGGGVTFATSNGTVTTGTSTIGNLVVSATGAVTLGTTTVTSDLNVSTNGAITDTGTITVPGQTNLTAGAANDITLDAANNDFNGMRVVSAKNVVLVDKTGINFGNSNGSGGYSSHVYGTLSVTAAGNISQQYSDYDGYSAVTVDGATTFTANASTPINLLMGPSDPFNGNNGESNTFTGGITLVAGNVNTGFTNVYVRNISASASTLTGLTSVGALNNVSLRYDSAPSVTLPGMTLAGGLRVYAPSVLNTATVPGNTISQSGAIVVAGGTVIGAGSSGDVVLTNAANNFYQFGIANSGARNASVVDTNGIVIYGGGYNQVLSGSYNVTAGGNISDLANSIQVQSGTATFNAGTGDVSLQQVNYWNILGVTANNVIVKPTLGMIFDNSTIAGTLNVTSFNTGYTLSQVAGTAVNMTGHGTTTFANFSGGITLANTGNVFGNLAITQAGTINIRENDPITQQSAWTSYNTNGGATLRYAVALTTSDDQAITLDQSGNYFGDLTLTQVHVVNATPGAVYVRENADSYYGMTQGSAWTVHGTTKLDSGAYSITLANANNVFGPLQVLASTGTTNVTASSITLYGKNATVDAITDVGGPGAWSTGGQLVKMVAYDSTGTTAGGGNIILANTGNVMGDLLVKGTNVTITENDTITDGPNASWNGAGDVGWATTGATNLIVANPTGKSITLDNLGNVLGPIGVTTSGTAGTLTNVLITDNSNLTQASAWNVGAAPVTVDARAHAIDLSMSGNVLGALSITTINGSPTALSVTENDAITQGGVWSLTGVPVTLVAENNKSITLTNASNILGNLTVTGGAVSIVENDPITQGGAWTTTGVTTLNATANAITLTNVGNVLGDIAIAGTPSAVSITENDDITQASAWVQASTPFVLKALNTHDILLTKPANQLGDLTLTAQNVSVVESDAAGITDGGAWTVPGTTTLAAGAGNAIILNANPASDLGTVSIVSASNADINDVNGIVFGASTIAAGGTLTVTAGGTITQSGAIVAPSMRLIGAGNAILTNASNNVGSIAAGFSGGDLIFTDSGNFSVGVFGGTTGITIGSHGVTLTSVAGTVTGLTNVNASTAALAVSTGTALSLPQMSIAGLQTYTASTVSGSGITLTANLNSTAAGAITFNSPVTLAADLSIQSTNSAINFNSTVAGGTNQLAVNAGTGAVEFTQAVSALGALADAGAALSISSSGVTFDSTLSANNGLAITGPVIFKDNVTLADGNAASVFAGLVTLGKAGGMNLSGYDGMTFNGGVLLQSGAATINSNDSALAFQTAGSVSGPYALTLNAGVQTLTGLSRMGSDLTSLTVTSLTPTIPSGGVTINGPQTYTASAGSNIVLNGPVTSTAAGAITFNSPVTIGVSATVTSTDSAVVFNGTVDGAHDLTVASGTGTKTFTGQIGNFTSLGDGTGAALILQGSGATTFSNTVVARSGITSAGAVDFYRNVTLTDGDTGSVFGGVVTSGGSTGNTITGFDGIAFNGGLRTSGGAVNVLSNGSTLALGGPVIGTQNLSLNALAGGAGTITGLDQIGNASTLIRLDLIAQTLSLPSTGLAVNGPMNFTAAGGITLNGAVGSSNLPASTGAITFNSPVLLATGPIVVTANYDNVTFGSTVNGAQALTVNTGIGATAFNGAVGGTTALSSLTTDAGGTTAINGGSIRTSGAQNYADAVTLGAATTLTGVGVAFNGTLNGANALTVNDSGLTRFGGVVGGTTALTSIVTDAAGTVAVNTSAITTTGSQTYNENLTLGANTTLAGNGVRFNGTLDGAYALTTNAGSGALVFGGSVGASTPLTSLVATGTTVSAVDVATSGTQAWTAVTGLTLGGALTTTNSNVTITGATTLGADVSINTGSGAGNILFSGVTTTINGAHGLTLAAGTGNVLLGAVVGATTPLTSVAISGYDLTLPSISTVGSTNQTYTALDNITLNQSRTLGAPVAFTADADGDGTGSFILLNGVSLTASNNTLSITAADIDLQGSSTLSSGTGVTTITASTGRNLALGGADAAGQLTLSGNELSRITSSGGLDLKTTGTAWIHVNGITTTQSQNITGPLGLKAQGTGDVDFITAASTFNAVAVTATGGTTHLGVDLTTTNDPIDFMTPVAMAAAATVNSGGGAVNFHGALTLGSALTVSTGNGTLNFGGAVGGNKTLTANLGSGLVTGLGRLQPTITGLTVNSSSGITLPGVTIAGPQVYNTGAITVTGDLVGTGITLNNLVDVQPASGSAVTINSGTGTLALTGLASFNANNVSLIGDEINFARAVTGTGSLLLQASTAGRYVVVGAGGTLGSVLNLTAAELALLPLGTLSSVTLGNASGTGTLDVAGPLAIGSTPLTLNGGGGITQSGGSITSGALSLYAAGSAITLANGANAFGAVAINGTPSAVSLANSLDITQQGSAAWNLGNAALTLNAGTHDIALTNAGNSFGTVTLTGRNATLAEADATNLGASTLSGNLTVASAGVVTQSGALNIGGNLDVTTSVAAGDVSIDNSGAASTSIGNTKVGGNYTLVATNESVAQAPGASLQVLGDLSVTGASVVLGGAGNMVGGSTSLPATNTFELRASGLIELHGRIDTGNLTVVSEKSNRAFGSTQVAGSAITLTNAANNVRGSISVSASAPTITTGPDVQTGIYQEAGTTISVAGTASFTAEASSAGSLGIDLSNAGNQFGTLQFSANTVNVNNASTGTTTLAGANASTSLTLTTGGAVTQTGAVATPTLSIAAAGPVTLTNATNDVNSLNVTAAGAIAYTDVNGFAITGIDAGGSAVALTAGGSGNILQSGAMQHVGTLTATAGGAITLTNAGNTIDTLGAMTAGTGLQVTDSAGGLAIAGNVRTILGDETVRTSGDLTLDTGSHLQADAGNVVASTEGAGEFINNAGASALVVGTGRRWLVYSSTPDLVSGAHTVKGGLTSSFRHYGESIATYAPGSVTEAGNGFIYTAATGALTVSAAIVGSPSQVYGDAPTGHVGYVISAGLVDSEDTAANIISGGSAGYSMALSNTLNAGSYSVLYIGGLTSNYTLVADTTGAAYTVTPATLTYTANAATRVYGATTPTLGGSVGGYKLSDTAAVLSGSATWTTAAVTGSNVGAYSIGGSGYTAANYIFAQAAGNASALTVTRAALTVTAAADSKVYDGLAYAGGAGVSYSAFANSEDATVLGGSLVYGGTAQGARNAGSYVIAASGLTSGNYTITYATGALTVARAALTLAAGDVTKTYDGTLAATGVAAATGGTQLFGSDAVSGGTFAFTNANAGAGNKTVTTSGVAITDGNGGNNYTVTYAANTTSTINQADITLASSNVTKTYDGTWNANGTATVVSGTLFRNISHGNVFDVLGGGSFAFTDANAGTGKTVTASNVTLNDGNSGGNYNVHYVDNTAGTVNRATLNYVGTVASKAYDGNTSATLSGYSLTGYIGTETLLAASTTASYADKNAGTGKTVAIGGISLANGTNGGLAANYTVASTATATGVITPKLLSVAATVADKVYNGNTAATLQGYGLSGFVGSETVTGVYTGSASFADKNVGAAKAVTITGIALVNGSNGGLASNYAVAATATSNASITPAALHVAGVVALDKVYDGTTAAVLNTQSALLTGVIGSDAVAVNSITGTYLDKNVGTAKAIGSGTYLLSGNDAGNYSLVQPTGLSANITPRTLAVTATGVDKVYDATTVAGVVLADNRVAGDLLNVTDTAAFLDKNIGTSKFIGVSGIAISGNDALNYTVNSSTAAFATITPAVLAISATGVAKVYDATTGASVVLGDNHLGTDLLTLAYGTAAFGDKNVGSAKSINVGGITVTGADIANYTYNTATTTTAAITPATITGVAGITAADKVYDGTTTATLAAGPLVFSGMLAGDHLSATAVNAVFDDKNAGTNKSVTIAGLVLGGADAGNYLLSSSGTTSHATIAQAALHVGATASNKVYDATTVATATLSDDRIAGDLLDLSFSGAAFVDKNAGTGKSVTVSGISLAGIDAGNYVVNHVATTTADIAKATLTIGATGVNKVYDTTTTAGVSLSDDRLAGDVLNIGYGSANFIDKNAGTGKVVTVAGIALSGTDAGNYAVASTSTATADIAKANLTIGATGIDKVYDTTTVAAVNLADNRLGQDALTIGYTSAAFADKNAATGKVVSVNGITVTGADAGNYVANTATSTTASISRAQLNVTAAAQGKVYDGNTQATVMLSETPLAGDDVSVGFGNATYADKNAAVGKTVTVSGIALGGADAGNYAFNNVATATADIAKATLVVNAAASNKVYDTTTAATVGLVDNRVTGDVIDIGYGSANFIDKNAGTGKVVTVAGIALSGTDAGNYAVASTSTTTADIAKANLTIGATGIDKVYDTTTAATVNLADNRLGQDALNIGYATAAFADKNAASGKAVTVNGITVTGADAGNYVANSATSTTASIAKAQLNVTAAAQGKVYDGNAHATVTLSETPLAGDDVTVGFGNATYADKNAAVGKTVTVSGIALGGADAGNYAFNNVATATADIAKATLVVNAAASNKVYDTTTAATVGLVDNRVTGDVIDIGYGSANFIDKNAGTGKVVTVAGIALSGVDAGNYAVASTSTTTADIAKANLTIGATGIDKVYDTTTAAAVNLADNRLGHDALTIGYATAAFADKNAATGKVVSVNGITVTGADAGNYVANSATSTTASIARAQLNVTAAAQGKVYDGDAHATVTLSETPLAGDDVSVGFGNATYADKNAGAGKTVSVSGIVLGGADAGNYAFNGTATTTADIAKAMLTIGATGVDKVYDTTTAATVGINDNRVAGDVLSIGVGTATFFDKNAGSGKAVSVKGITVTGADAGNYVGNSTASTTAGIAKAALTVAATGVDKVYDTTTAATVHLTDNRLGTDALTVGYTTAAFADKNAGTGKTVAVGGIGVTGTDAGNYTTNVAASTTASIAKAALSVTATAQDKVYDATTKAVVTLSGAPLAGDNVVVGFGSAAFADKNVGRAKAVTVNGVALSGTDAGNYTTAATIATPTTTASITPATLVVAATGESKLFDGTALARVGLTDNRYAGDSLALAGVSSFDDAQVGNGKTVTVTGIRASGVDAGNYVLASTQASTKADITSFADTWSLTPPPVPQPTAPTVRMPVAVLDLTLPIGFGSGPAISSPTAVAMPATTVGTGGISVALVRPSAGGENGLVSVSVPKAVIANGSGFAFPLPAQLAEAARGETVAVTLPDGLALPNWLRYVPESQTFSVSAPPTGALPMQVMVQVGKQRWLMTIEAQAAN